MILTIPIRIRFALFIALLVVVDRGSSASINGIQYLSPLPGSSMISPQNNIIIRPGGLLDAGSISTSLLQVLGTESGPHDGALQLSDDAETLVFQAYEPFAPREKVIVSLLDGLRKADRSQVPSFSFEFTIASRWGQPHETDPSFSLGGGPPSFFSRDDQTANYHQLCDTLPADYPDISFSTINMPDPGNVFLAPFPSPSGTPGHLVILDNAGEPMFYRRMVLTCLDFKKQPDGTLTYFDASTGRGRFYQLDSSYAVIDSFSTGNGYTTDLHELVLLENDHALLMSYDFQIVRMDTVVIGGDSAATVIGLIIQELDAQKNVVFQWRSWDHFEITDGSVSGLVDLTSDLIDYVHGNAIEPDLDGNLLISSRHMNEITKIDRGTGDIIWRLGLNAVNNGFTFTNDPRGWSHQHDVRRLANGNITLYDNGNFLSPEYSRGLEYQLDEVAMTATLVWEHRNDPDAYGPFMGNVQRLESGGSMIGWGGSSAVNFTEVGAGGETRFEGGFPPAMFNYRTFRHHWKTNLFRVSPDTLDFGFVAPGDSAYRALVVSNNSADPLLINCSANSDSAFSSIGVLPVTIPPNSSIGLTLAFKPSEEDTYLDLLYIRSVNDTQLVAQSVTLQGTSMVTGVDDGNGEITAFRLDEAYPNPFNAISNFEFGIAKWGEVSLRVFDILGREVATIVDEKLNPGTYTRQWDATGFSSGVYFYRMQAGGFVETRKLLLIR